MNVFLGAARVVARSAEAATAAAGAVSGAAVNGVIGGLQGTVNGIKNGVSSGSHSTPAALLTLGAIGAAGLVDWPVLLGIGGTALAVRQLNQRAGGTPPPTAKPTLSAVPDEPRKRSTASAASRPAPAKVAKAPTPAKAVKTTAPRKTTRKTTAATRRPAAKK
jgi:hypothetical protein